MYRFLAGALACAATIAGTVPVHSSSITTLPAALHNTTHSIVTVGDVSGFQAETYPADENIAVEVDADIGLLVVTKSILAIGADAIPVTQEAVTAMPEKRRQPAWVAQAMPTVMRGGIVGEPYEKAGTTDTDDAAASSDMQPPRQPQ